MAWIDLPDDEASAELSRLTKRYRDEGRPTPAVIGIMKPSPKTMRAVAQMNSAVTFGGSVLGPKREEMIATGTSSINDCFY
jgi:hypothetical protein